MHALNLVEDLRGICSEGGFQYPSLINAAFQRMGDGKRLFVDLLKHVMAVFATLDSISRQFRTGFRAFNHFAVTVVNYHTDTGQVGDIAIFQEDESLGNRQQRGNVGSDKIFADTNSDHQRTATPRGNQAIGFCGTDHTQCISTFQVLAGMWTACSRLSP